MLHAQAEIDGQVRRHAPVVLDVEVVLPVAHVAVDAAGQLGVGREHAEQHVGVAVAGAERIVRVVAEVEVAHVVGRARLGLAVVFERHAHLEVVPPSRHREVVVEVEPAAQVQAGNRLVGLTESGQPGPIAARGRESRRIRPLVDLLADPRDLRRIRIVRERLEPRRIDVERGAIERRVVEVVCGLEAPAVVRVAEADLVDDGRLEHLRDGAGDQQPGRVLVDEAGARRETVPAPVVVPVLHEPRIAMRVFSVKTESTRRTLLVRPCTGVRS